MPAVLTTEQFVEKARAVHGDRYGYEKSSYSANRKPLTITCAVHGDFEQTPEKHLAGKGCRHCGYGTGSDKRRLGACKFIEKSRTIHGGKYDYSRVAYTNNNTDVEIVCPTHGSFLQQPKSHLKGRGCGKCWHEALSRELYLDTDEYIRRAKKVHGEAYDYSRVAYTDSVAEVEIICPKHGVFKQIARNHLQGNGCGKCFGSGPSTPELELLAYVKSLDPTTVGSDRKTLRPVELDIHAVAKKVAVEFNGLYWHSEQFRDAKYHVNKLEACEEKNIGLIQIHSDEWAAKPEIVKSIISARLNAFSRVEYGRKTKLEELDAKTARTFFQDNHIQGFTGAESYYGLYAGSELISAIAVGKPRHILRGSRENTLEVIRFCNKLNTRVIGGLSKLLKPFAEYDLLSYCDRRLFNGNGYAAAGFTLERVTPPSYVYANKHKVLSRFQCQKHKLANLLENFDPMKTEVENMQANGYYRVFDCGNLVMVKPRAYR